ncbi:MAG: hypothetical protein R3E79_40515 [Caldilineaceae bacterium]
MKHLLLIIMLALFWGISGSLIGVAINAFLDTSIIIQCASLNVIIGMILLLLVTRNETARRLFYDGPRGDEPGFLPIAILWTFPFILLFLGLFWWLLAQFLR